MKLPTKLTRIGRPKSHPSPVNVPVERGSTITTSSAGELYDTPEDYPLYGTSGLTTQNALKDAMCELMEADVCALAPTGLSAMTLPILCEAQAGGHILATDSSYLPVRRFLEVQMRRWGIETEFYDPKVGVGISELIRDNTQLVICETPGSLTFDVQDIPAIVAAAHGRGVKVMTDDTWSGGLICNMLDLGVDYAAQALTKYVGGHSDILLGAVQARGETAARLRTTEENFGIFAAAEDCYLALRGMRTAAIRMEKSGTSSLELVDRLLTRSENMTINHPGHASHPDHALYAGMFDGTAGLFGVTFHDWDQDRARRFLDALNVFGLGFSWGGYESLAIPCDAQINRQHYPGHTGQLLRFAVGIEDVDDLWTDIEQALDSIK